MNTSEHFAAVAAGLASAIWTLHRGETVIAQMEAARAQQAAEAACIGLTLDDEKITSLSASTRRHLQGLALVIQVQPCITVPRHITVVQLTAIASLCLVAHCCITAWVGVL